MKQAYQDINFRKTSLVLIEIMNALLADFRAEGYVVTVRQLYYQLVAKDLIENTEKSYKKITGLVNDARMAGLMDWNMIEDRTRSFDRSPFWSSPGSIVRASAQQFDLDRWDNQDTRVYCIVEKEALAGVLARPCREWSVPLLAARGYPSVTVIREFVEEDIIPALRNGQNVQIIHLGDHDPSGLDMTRDLKERIALFADSVDYRGYFDVTRIALNMDQVDEQQPPPNPAKSTDSRFADYKKMYGDESWELDALSPRFINDLVVAEISQYVDEDAWEAKAAEVAEGRKRIAVKAQELEKME